MMRGMMMMRRRLLLRGDDDEDDDITTYGDDDDDVNITNMRQTPSTPRSRHLRSRPHPREVVQVMIQ